MSYITTNELKGVKTGRTFSWYIIEGSKIYPVKVQIQFKKIKGETHVEFGKKTCLPEGGELVTTGLYNTGSLYLRFNNKSYLLLSVVRIEGKEMTVLFGYLPKGVNGSDGPMIYSDSQNLESARA